jgi:hypothetical protein
MRILRPQRRIMNVNGGVRSEVRVIATPQPSGDDWDSYITIKLTAEPRFREQLEEQLAVLYRKLQPFGIHPQFNSCVQGKYNGTLKNDVQLAKIEQLFQYLDATVVEKVEDPTVKSFSAFTDEIKPFILTRGQKMNVQAGMHVDKLGGVTRITIGTPIITIEY